MKKEQFENLEQLDRIEYFLHKERLKKKCSIISISMIFLLVKIIFMFMVVGLLIYIATDSIEVFKVFDSLSYLLRWCLITAVIVDIIQIIVYIVKSRKLDDIFLKRGGYK